MSFYMHWFHFQAPFGSTECKFCNKQVIVHNTQSSFLSCTCVWSSITTEKHKVIISLGDNINLHWLNRSTLNARIWSKATLEWKNVLKCNKIIFVVGDDMRNFREGRAGVGGYGNPHSNEYTTRIRPGIIYKSVSDLVIDSPRSVCALDELLVPYMVVQF